MTSVINTTLKERGEKYGRFEQNALKSQVLKETLRKFEGFDKLNDVQKEALDLICTKISRMLSGDPDYYDNWRDIAGFATLAENDINERAVAKEVREYINGKQ